MDRRTKWTWSSWIGSVAFHRPRNHRVDVDARSHTSSSQKLPRRIIVVLKNRIRKTAFGIAVVTHRHHGKSPSRKIINHRHRGKSQAWNIVVVENRHRAKRLHPQSRISFSPKAKDMSHNSNRGILASRKIIIVGNRHRGTSSSGKMAVVGNRHRGKSSSWKIAIAENRHWGKSSSWNIVITENHHRGKYLACC